MADVVSFFLIWIEQRPAMIQIQKLNFSFSQSGVLIRYDKMWQCGPLLFCSRVIWFGKSVPLEMNGLTIMQPPIVAIVAFGGSHVLFSPLFKDFWHQKIEKH